MNDFPAFLRIFEEAIIPTTVESTNSPIFNERVVGYVYILQNSAAVLITPNPRPYIIPDEIAHRYFLSTGDKVTASATDSGDQNTVLEIIRVNRQIGIPTNFTKHFDNILGSASEKMLPVFGRSVNTGKTIMLVTEQCDNVVEKIQTVTTQCDKSTVKIELEVDGRQEDLNYLLSNGYDYGYLTSGRQPLKQQLMILLIAFFRAKELAENGKEVIFTINNMEKMLILLNNAIILNTGVDGTHITMNALRDFSNLIKSSKILANGGSLTIFGLFTTNDTDPNKTLLTRFSSICDYVI
jgi:transcription termination factor Rho